MTEIAIVAALVVAYAAVASRLDEWSVTPAIVFTAAGAVLGPDALGVLDLSIGAESTKLLAEFALAILLFGDATTVDPRAAGHDGGLIARLLVVGLPLTVLAGAAAALVLSAAGWAEALLLGAMLAPTDAALGLAVFTNRAVPLPVRRVLNVESGLNDGLATPVVTLLVAVVVTESAVSGGDWILDALLEMGIGAGLGVAVGAVGALVLGASVRTGRSAPGPLGIGVLAVAVLAYAGALALGGNGFVGAFIAGLAFRAAGRGALRSRVEYTEATGQVLTMVVWILFGALLAAPAIADGVEAAPVLYAILSLTVVRSVPVALALVGSRLQPETVAFMGWFGPRGMASVVFTLLLVTETQEAGAALPSAVLLAASWTILLSVVAHGLTAGRLGRRYGAVIAARGPGLRETAEGGTG